MTDFRRAESVMDEEGEAAEAQPLPSPGPTSASQDSSAEIAELLHQARESVVSVEDSELHVLARISAEFAQTPTKPGLGGFESLRDSEIDRLLTEDPITLPGMAPEPPAAAKQKDFPERVAVMPRTHPLANSIAPTAAAKTVPPPADPKGPFWQILAAAAALVGLGFGISQLSGGTSRQAAHLESPVAVVSSTAASAAVTPSNESLTVRAPDALGPAAVERGAAPASAEVLEVSAPGEQPLATAEEVTQPAASSAEHKSTRGARSMRVKQVTPKPAKSSGKLPAQPSRDQVVATMKAAMPALDRCAAGRRGVVSARLTVRGSGQVSYALIEGSFAGTREGTCLAKALREIRFPAFSQPSFKLTYPLQF